eukprot:g3322.t1
MALRSWFLLFPGCCAATPSSAPLLFQFIPRADEHRKHINRLSSSTSVEVRSDFDASSVRGSSRRPIPQQSRQDGAVQASMFGGKKDGVVRGADDGRVRPEEHPSEGLFPRQNQSSRLETPRASGAAAFRDGTPERCRRSPRHQQDAVDEPGGFMAETLRRRGEGGQRGASADALTTCGEYEAIGAGVGGGRRRRPWLNPHTQPQPLHRQQESRNYPGYVESDGGRRRTAVFMSAPGNDGGGVEWSASGAEPTIGGGAAHEGGGLGEDEGANGETNADSQAFGMPTGDEALPLLPGATAAATSGAVVTPRQRKRPASKLAATPTATASPTEAGAGGGINGFELEAATGGGESAEAEAMSPLAETYERGRWLLGLLALQSTSSFVLDKYQDLLRQHVVVTLFLTMLVGAGGNAGNQSAIKVIRGLATGRFTADAPCALKVIGQQAAVGLLLGTALAAGGFVRVWVTDGTTLRDASAISMSLFLIVMVSVLLGSGLPFGFARAGVDPAHAGTTIQVAMDIVGVAVTCVTCSFVLTQLEQALPLPL